MRLPQVTVERTLIAAYMLSIVGIFTLGFLFFFATRQEVIASNWVTHTESAIGDIEAIHRLALDAESTGRAFLITGNDENLARYRRLIPQLYNSVATFKASTADNANQQRRADRLVASLDVRFRYFNDRLEIRRDGGMAALMAMPNDGRGSAEMDRVTAVFRGMVGEEA